MIQFIQSSGELIISNVRLYVFCNLNIIIDTFSNEKAEVIQKKKSTVVRIEIRERWWEYETESIAVELDNNKLKRIDINFLPNNEINIIGSAADLSITIKLKELLGPGIKKNQSQYVFNTSWGSLSIEYDNKLAATSAVIIYNL